VDGDDNVVVTKSIQYCRSDTTWLLPPLATRAALATGGARRLDWPLLLLDPARSCVFCVEAPRYCVRLDLLDVRRLHTWLRHDAFCRTDFICAISGLSSTISRVGCVAPGDPSLTSFPLASGRRAERGRYNVIVVPRPGVLWAITAPPLCLANP
jgi:hypothetical protein